MAGASPPQGRALAFRSAWTHRSTGHRPARAGETRVAFPVPARRDVLRDALSLWQGPSPLPQRCAGIRTSRGPMPPASARPAQGGRFSPAGSGAGLLLFPDLPVYRTPSRAGGGNALRFPFPPMDGPEGLAAIRQPPLPWQRPSPLPQRYAVTTPAGGQSPRPAPDPPPAGASPPPGRALAFRDAWTCRSTGHRPARAGKRGSRFLFPPGKVKALSPLQWQGPSPLPQRCADPWPAGGQSPRPAPDPPTAGASPPQGRALAFRSA